MTSKISDSDDSDIAPVKPSAKAKTALISDSDEEVAKPKKRNKLRCKQPERLGRVD